MNEHSFFWLLLNIDRSENFSNFKTDDEFVLSSCEKLKVVVYEILSSAISVWSFLIVLNRVWTTLKIKVVKFMMYVILWLMKIIQCNVKEWTDFVKASKKKKNNSIKS